MTLRSAYDELLRQATVAPDAEQRSVVAALNDLQRRIADAEKRYRGLRRWLAWRHAPAPPRGLYLWGGVGRGKTFLMDLFFRTLPIRSKKRMHFHRILSDVHHRLGALGDLADPLDTVAADLAAETRVLCFDEFFVSDIGDAMILGRLLDGLFRRGVTLVATSNVPPADLYRDGLQRARFLPAIELLERHTEVVELGGETDYRLRLLERAGTWLTPAGDDATRQLAHYFDGIESGAASQGAELDLLGRPVRTVRAAKGIVWFDFGDICEGPRSQEDYIEIARWYPTVIVSGVPVLDRRREDAARRFIALVDEFYDRKVKLVVSADAAPASIYRGSRLEFEFQRTSSRLIEMQTAGYLHAQHLA